MASSFSSLSASLLCFFFLFFFVFFENKTFAYATREASGNHDEQLQHLHLLHLSSLLPSPTCTSYAKGANKKGSLSLEVIHKHGACSKLKKDASSSSTLAQAEAEAPIIPHAEILKQDEARVRSIHSLLSKMGPQKELDGSKGLGQVQLPAKSGSLLGTGNYFVTVGLGSPKRDLSLVFDTGSDLTWTQCEPCARSCYDQKEPIFNPSKSSSYSNISCTSSLCTQLSSNQGIVSACSAATKSCVYGIQYFDSSFSIGYFSKEKLTVSPTDVIDDFLFGCGQDNEGLFHGIAGLLGLGPHPISFVQQTAKKYNKIFSYCLPSTSSSVGYLTFGGKAASGNVKYTPFSTILRGSSFYGLDITEISVNGTKLPISASVFSSSGTIIDSGTVITRLPPSAYGPLRDAFRRAMSKYPKAAGDSLLDTCYDLSGYKEFSVPKISLSFGGGVTVELDARGILFVISEKQVCLAFAGNKDDSSVAILGNVQQKTLEVVYDVAGGRVGFGAAGCQ